MMKLMLIKYIRRLKTKKKNNKSFNHHALSLSPTNLMFICKTASIRWLSRSCLATAAWYTPHRKYSLGSCPFSFHSGSSIKFKMLFKDNRAPNNYYIWRPLHSSFILLTLPVPASSSRWDPHLGISCVSNVTTSARERRMRRSTGLIHTYKLSQLCG